MGFERTYRQDRPNPYAVVERGDLHLHLFGMEGFDPAQSYGSVIVAVPDPDQMYAEFAAGLRTAYGKLPSAGIPRILRPRKKQGTVGGFSVVDPGGNWLRFSRRGDTEEEAAREPTTGLARVIGNAVRQGDARGNHDEALRLLAAGLTRFVDAPAADRVRALLYQAELAVRADDSELSVSALAEAESITLSADAKSATGADFAHAREVVAGIS